MINQTKNTVLAEDPTICDSILSRSLGLMFRKFRPLIFVFNTERIVPLHTFFVFYPIDVLFLNRHSVVVELKENFMPFRIYTPEYKANFVVELPQGIIERSDTEVGDMIEL